MDQGRDKCKAKEQQLWSASTIEKLWAERPNVCSLRQREEFNLVLRTWRYLRNVVKGRKPTIRNFHLKTKINHIKRRCRLLKSWGYSPKRILGIEGYCDIWFRSGSYKYAIDVLLPPWMGPESTEFNIKLPFFYNPIFPKGTPWRTEEEQMMAELCSKTNRARVYLEEGTGYATAEISCTEACPADTKEQFESCLNRLESAANLFNMCMID